MLPGFRFSHLSGCLGEASFLKLYVELGVELKLFLLVNLQPRECNEIGREGLLGEGRKERETG